MAMASSLNAIKVRIDRLLAIAVKPGDQLMTIRRKKILTGVLLVGAPHNLFLLPVFYYLAIPVAFWLLFLHTVFLTSLIFIHRKIGTSLTSAVASIWTSLWLVAIGGIIQGDIGIEYIFVVLAVIPLAVINPKKRSLQTAVFLIVTAIAMSWSLSGWQDIGLYKMDEWQTKIIRNTAYFALLSLTAVFVKAFIAETERLRINSQESERKMFQASKLADLGTLAAGVAHEINNPTTIAASNLEFISKEVADKGKFANPWIAKRVKRIDDALKRTTQIVRSLLDLARDPQYENIDQVPLKQICGELKALLRSRAIQHDIAIDISQVNEQSTVQFRRSELGQVLLNLLSNAIDALACCSSESKQIKVSLSESPDHVHIIVADNGPGVPEECVEKIMDPFFTTKEVGKGTGLGLSICFKIIQSNQGLLYYKRIENWSRFVIQLPNKQDSKSTKVA